METFISNYQVFTEAKRGGRNYMEDVVCVKIPENVEERGDGMNGSLLYLAVFDGHGGPEAAEFAKDHLLNEITKQNGFWSDDDEQVTRAIKDGFLSTHKLMWTALDSWPKTISGLPSTAGTTASVVFIKGRKMYIAHVGDSSVVLGEKVDNRKEWSALTVTKEHKPDAAEELCRIQNAGGQVMSKAGIARVVWKRPRVVKGPMRRSTVIDNVPFLAIARSLGDLWSYDAERDEFVVSPEPDVTVLELEDSDYQCIIVASDGVWNMIKPEEAIRIVSSWYQNHKEAEDEPHAASVVVDLALERWKNRQIRADNTSAIVAFLNRVGDCNNRSLAKCDHSVNEKLSSSWISPSKSSFLSLVPHKNRQSSIVEGKIPKTNCKVRSVSQVHVSKEDRFGSKWRKIKRKSLPGFRIHLRSIGSGDNRITKVVRRRRHTLPSAKANDSLELSGLIGSNILSCMSRSSGANLEHKNRTESPLNTKEDLRSTFESEGKLKGRRLNSVCLDPPNAILCSERLKHSDESPNFDSGSSSRKEILSSSVCEPLAFNDETVTDSSANLDSISNLLISSKSNTSPESCSAGIPSSSPTLKRVASAYCKCMRGSEIEASLPVKRPCLDSSHVSRHSYRTRFHTRLRIPVE